MRIVLIGNTVLAV